MVATYKNTVLCFTSTETIGSYNISITHCQSEEADQRLIRHILHCILAQYKKIVVHTVDAGVFILLIPYVSQFYDFCTDFNVYAHMVNWVCEYYDVISAIFDLDKETCNALPFFMHSLDVTLYQVFFQRENAGRGTHGIKVNRRMYWQIFFF